MKGKEKSYFICGLLFIIAGVLGILNGRRMLAYSFITIGLVFFVLSKREQKNDDGNQNDNN